MRLVPELQAIFDRVEAHLVVQAAPSLSEAGICLYRGCEGRMCAIGVLIPDELYLGDIEGSIGGLMGDSFSEARMEVARHLEELAPSVEPEHLACFLEALQVYHDGPYKDDVGCPETLAQAVRNGMNHEILQCPRECFTL